MPSTKERFFLELEPPTEELRDKPHVVIVGGALLASRLAKHLKVQMCA